MDDDFFSDDDNIFSDDDALDFMIFEELEKDDSSMSRFNKSAHNN